MTITRKKLLAGVAFASLFLVSPARADVAVIDFSALADLAQQIGNQVQAYALQMKQLVTANLSWLQQVQSYATQVEQYAVQAEQLAGFIHDPSLGAAGAILNTIGLGSSLPINPLQVISLVNGFSSTNGVSSIMGNLNALNGLIGVSYNANHVYTPTDNSWASARSVANANSIAGTQGAASAAYGDLQTHQAALAALQARALTAVNPKDVADLQVQIAAQQTWIANESASMQAIGLAANVQQASRQQQADEKFDSDLEGFYRSIPPPQ